MTRWGPAPASRVPGCPSKPTTVPGQLLSHQRRRRSIYVRFGLGLVPWLVNASRETASAEARTGAGDAFVVAYTNELMRDESIVRT